MEWSFDLVENGSRPVRPTPVTIALNLSGPHDPLHASVTGMGAGLDLQLPARPGHAVRYRTRVFGQSTGRPPQALHREFNHRRSGLVISGMVLLLALSGWIIGGEDGARWAVCGGFRTASEPQLYPDVIHRQFGAKLLHPSDMPALFAVFQDICCRARLPRLPDLYFVPASRGMNAYALGGPDASAIILTEGLLCGMTVDEVASIIAHEIGHIRNNDGWSMTVAAALSRATSLTSMLALMRLEADHEGRLPRPLAALLGSAPVIGRLLQLGLSRIREFDADAVALELVDDPRILVAALGKLERHHTGLQPLPPITQEDPVLQFLRSHPATWQRIGTLLSLGCP